MSAQLGRWDPLNPRVIIAMIHLGFAFVLTVRPHLFELHGAWSGFLAIMPQNWWAISTFFTGTLVLFMPRASLGLMLAQFLSMTMLFTISTVASTPTGLNTGSSTYLILALASLLMFARTGVAWFAKRHWLQRLATKPPRWFRRWTPEHDRDA